MRCGTNIRSYGFLAAVLCTPFLFVAGTARADEVTLETVKPVGENKADEPIAPQFSLPQAVKFLDSAALDWQKQRQCFTCHTNYAYLMARPLVSADVTAHKQVRAFAEQLVTERWEKLKPRWDAEVVATAEALAFNDAQTTGKLHEVTKRALDRMWTVQKGDGGFSWLKCGWPPMESDDHYGATLCAIAAGVAPGDYAKTPAAVAGIDKLKIYFKANPPPTLHHKAMLVWANSYLPTLVPETEVKVILEEIKKQQHADGGWSASSLGPFKRGDGKEQDLATSDGYGTGFSIFVLRRAGMPANDPAVAKGIEWLKKNQRQSGRWFTRSLNKDNKHYLTHAGTAFSVMAIQMCDKATAEK